MKLIITEQVYQASNSSDQREKKAHSEICWNELVSEARHGSVAAVPEIQPPAVAAGGRDDGDTVPRPHGHCSAGEPRQRSSGHQQVTFPVPQKLRPNHSWSPSSQPLKLKSQREERGDRKCEMPKISPQPNQITASVEKGEGRQPTHGTEEPPLRTLRTHFPIGLHQTANTS